MKVFVAMLPAHSDVGQVFVKNRRQGQVTPKPETLLG